MEKLQQYRKIVTEYLNGLVKDDHEGLPPHQSKLVADEKSDSYIYMYYDWKDKKYSYIIYIHIDIIDSRIWLQRNNTEEEVVDVLMEQGIPAEDIVLGIVAPYMREATPFAHG